jgi:hypothetical protein
MDSRLRGNDDGALKLRLKAKVFFGFLRYFSATSAWFLRFLRSAPPYLASKRKRRRYQQKTT